MILTITANPSVDISYQLDELVLDKTNRVKVFAKTAGGKGLNVSRVLMFLGDDVVATGFLGGVLGEFIEDKLVEQNIKPKFQHIDGETRNCVGIIHEGKQTEINEPGPTINEKDAKAFLDLVRDLIKDVNVVTVSGSLPAGLPKDYYLEIVKIAREAKKPIIVDTSGEALEHVVHAEVKPDLIKPNLDELSQFLGRKVTSDPEELKEVLSSGDFKDIPYIVISLGKDGAVAKMKDNYYRCEIPTVKAVNSVGSGDSTVAGLAHGLDHNLSVEETLKYAMTCGVLNTMHEKTGYIDMDRFDEIYSQIRINKL